MNPLHAMIIGNLIVVVFALFKIFKSVKDFFQGLLQCFMFQPRGLAGVIDKIDLTPGFRFLKFCLVLIVLGIIDVLIYFFLLADKI